MTGGTGSRCSASPTARHPGSCRGPAAIRGLILCAQRDTAVAHYALEGLRNRVLAAQYRTTLPDEQTIAAEVERTRQILEQRKRLLPDEGSGSPRKDPRRRTRTRSKS